MNVSYKWIIAIFLIGLFLRLVIAFSFEGTGDTGGWRLAGITGTEHRQVGIGNGTVFDGDCPLTCFNWPPLTYHYFVLSRLLFLHLNPLNLPDYGFYKLLPVVADSLSILMIYTVLRQKQTTRYLKPELAATIYSLHPLALQIAGYHGQRDTIWILVTLVAIYLLEKKRHYLTAIMFALGVSIKIPALYLAPIFTLKVPTINKKINFASLIVIVFFLVNLPEIVTHTANVIKQVFLYPGIPGWWGIQGIIAKLAFIFNWKSNFLIINKVNKILLLAMIVFSSFYLHIKTKKIEHQIVTMSMIVFVFSHIFASQYLLWPLAFMLILEKKYWRYMLAYSAVALYMSTNFYGFFGIRLIEKIVANSIQPFFYSHSFLSYPLDLGFLVWGFSCIFLYRLLKDASKKNN